MDSGRTTMTLAFELDALKRCTRPDEVFEDALRWTDHLGIISEKPSYVTTTFTREYDVLRQQDFFSGPYSRAESMSDIRESFDTERYVFVGTCEADREVADSVGWEYVPIGEAADAADWDLQGSRSEADSVSVQE